MSERSGGRERSEQSGASEQVSGASERGSGPVLTSLFLFVPDHSATPPGTPGEVVYEYFTVCECVKSLLHFIFLIVVLLLLICYDRIFGYHED